jgi:hypothetical protein
MKRHVRMREATKMEMRSMRWSQKVTTKIDLLMVSEWEITRLEDIDVLDGQEMLLRLLFKR